MNDKELKLSNSCKFIKYEYNNYIELEYVEYACDPFYSDHETSIIIEKEDAFKIIEFLKKSFKF
jgi:hypothetical protein